MHGKAQSSFPRTSLDCVTVPLKTAEDKCISHKMALPKKDGKSLARAWRGTCMSYGRKARKYYKKWLFSPLERTVVFLRTSRWMAVFPTLSQAPIDAAIGWQEKPTCHIKRWSASAGIQTQDHWFSCPCFHRLSHPLVPFSRASYCNARQSAFCMRKERSSPQETREEFLVVTAAAAHAIELTKDVLSCKTECIFGILYVAIKWGSLAKKTFTKNVQVSGTWCQRVNNARLAKNSISILLLHLFLQMDYIPELDAGMDSRTLIIFGTRRARTQSFFVLNNG